jgi:hypothetical protein
MPCSFLDSMPSSRVQPADVADWRPDAQKELLLRAALGETDAARQAWHEWQQTTNVEGLDWGSRRLLPLVRHNVGEPSDPQTWIDNHLLFQETSALVRLLHLAGIEVLAMKGVPLALLYYPDAALRPMADVDLLVRPRDAAGAMAAMMEAGWTTAHRHPERLIEFGRAVDLRSPNGTVCDLHWRAFRQGRQQDDDLWEHAIRLDLAGTPAHTLDAADQLLLVCVHGTHWNDMPSLRWVADATMIVRTGVDWPRVVACTQHRRLMLPMADTLSYLRHFAEVPADVLSAISRMPATRLERADYRATTGPITALHSLSLVRFWAQRWRLHTERRIGHRLMTLLRYFQELWHVEHLWQTPFRVLHKSVYVLSRLIFRSSARHL